MRGTPRIVTPRFFHRGKLVATVQVLLLAHEDKSLPYFRGNKRARVLEEARARQKKKKRKRKKKTTKCLVRAFGYSLRPTYSIRIPLSFLSTFFDYLHVKCNIGEGGEKEEKQFHLGNIERDLCELFIYSLDVFFHDR